MKFKLSDICDIKIGRTPPRKESQWFNTGLYSDYTWVSIKDLGECNKYIDFSSETISLDGQEKFNIPVAKTGTILLSFKLTVGRVAIATKNLLTNEAIAQLPIKDSSKVDRDFLYYYLLRYPWSTLGSTSSIATAINSKMIKEMEVELPDILMQRKIANILSTFDEKINTNYDINNNLEQQAQSIFKYWFVDFEPFGKKMPTDWCNGTIDDLAKDIVCGKTPSTRKADYYGTDIPFITIPDMHDKIYSITTERHLSVLGANSQAKKNLPKNSICVSCIGTAGLVTLVAEESQTNQQINSIIPKDEFSPYFIYLLMQTLSDTINKLGQGGSTIVNLNKSQFAKIQVTIPAIPAMTDFDKIVSPIFKKILQNQKENLCLTSLRDNLLSKLMSGELDVSNINI